MSDLAVPSSPAPQKKEPTPAPKKGWKKWRKRAFLLSLLLLLLLVSCGLLEGTVGTVVTVLFDLDEKSQDLLGGEVWEGGSLEELQRLARRGNGTVPHGERAEVGTWDGGRRTEDEGRRTGEVGESLSTSSVETRDARVSVSSMSSVETRYIASLQSSSAQSSSASPLRSARSLPSQASSASSASSAAPPPPAASSAQSAPPVSCNAQDLLTVRLRSPAGDMLVPSYHFENGRATVSIDDRRFRPGFYTLILTRTSPCTGESRTTEQSFPWGVLAMNTDADRYRPGETGRIDFGVLDEEGAIVCDADLTLTVTAPDGSQSVLSTENGGIRVTGTCGLKEAGMRMPDYDANITYAQEGTYRLHLFARRPDGVLKDSAVDTEVEVGAAPPFIVRRTAATRLWPAAASVVDIEVEFLEDFAGTIEERVPLSFAVSGLTPTGVLRPDPPSGEWVLRWKGSWKTGETAAFSYTFDAPDISPEFYLLGPLNFENTGNSQLETGIWQELRSWQIANDSLDGATRAKSTTYQIVSDVVPAGGGEDARSTNYMLADTIGEPSIGPSRSNTYELNAGYRQTVADAYLGLNCDDTAALGTIALSGQANANISCTVITDSEAGYTLAWTEGLPTGNLVGHWKLDEATAGTFTDSSGNGNVGTGYGAGGTNNTPQPDASVYSPYYSVRSTEFDGTDDYIQSTTRFTEVTSAITISAWVKPGASQLQYADIWGNHEDSFKGLVMQQNSTTTNQYSWGYGDGTSWKTTGTFDLTANTWHHVVGVKDGTSCYVYVNGEEVTSARVACSTAIVPAASTNFRIGQGYGGAGGGASGRFFNGLIDDVRVYDTALTLGQIQELASQSPPGALVMSGSQTTHLPSYHAPTAGLVGHWKMDETAAGSTVLDWSGSGNDGTPAGDTGANNKPQPSTTVPSGTNFGNSRSLDFDGTDDYVDMGDIGISGDNASITYSLWVNNAGQTSTKIFLTQPNAAENDGIVTLSVNTSNVLVAGLWEGSQRDIGNANLGQGSWHHVVLIHNRATDTRSLYVDGELNASDQYVGDGAWPFTYLHIGANHTGVSTFHGLIDDVRIYNRALSAEEVKALYASTQSWSVAASQAFWGARLSSTSTDTDSKWGTDGSSDQWLFIGDGSFPLVTRSTRTDPAGSTEILNVRAEVGGAKVQQAGAYRRTIMITVVPL